MPSIRRRSIRNTKSEDLKADRSDGRWGQLREGTVRYATASGLSVGRQVDNIRVLAQKVPTFRG